MQRGNRVDFVEDANGEFYVLEVNTVPGMTSHSLLPKAAKLINIDYDEVVEIIVKGQSCFNYSFLPCESNKCK